MAVSVGHPVVSHPNPILLLLSSQLVGWGGVPAVKT